jgi:hypothetical protein
MNWKIPVILMVFTSQWNGFDPVYLNLAYNKLL